MLDKHVAVMGNLYTPPSHNSQKARLTSCLFPLGGLLLVSESYTQGTSLPSSEAEHMSLPGGFADAKPPGWLP